MMSGFKSVAMAGAAALAIVMCSVPAQARHGFGGHVGFSHGGFGHGGFGHGGFARGGFGPHYAHGGFNHGFRGHRGRGFVGFYPYYAGYSDPYYYDDYYDDDDDEGYCYWRHGRRFCRY